MDVQDCKGIVLHLIGCLLIFYSGFMFGRATLPDHGNGAGEVRQELDRVEEYQRQAEDRVRDIEKTTGSVADAIDGSRKSSHCRMPTDYCGSTNKRNGQGSVK